MVAIHAALSKTAKAVEEKSETLAVCTRCVERVAKSRYS